MSIEWGPATKASADKLAKAIRDVATTPEQLALATRAEAGEFTDYSDDHDCPIMALVIALTAVGLDDIALRAKNGEFDATDAESDEWAKSASGRDTFAMMHKLVNLGEDKPN